MVYRGRVKDGVVILDGPDYPPDGAEVSVRVLSSRGRKRRKTSPMYEHYKPVIGMAKGLANGKAQEPTPTILERLQSVFGKAKGLPPDGSVNHDHYLYGADKRE